MVSDGSLFGHNSSGEAHNWYQFGGSLFGHNSSGEAHNWYQSGGPLFGHNNNILEKHAVHCSSWYLVDLCSVTTVLEKHATGIWRISTRSQQFWRGIIIWSVQYTGVAGI